ncbi:MAG TPA: endonuclease MutS2, partial [Clostridia bacterium]|nr:endonuclease MutS2 [Clostridia bacterium]
RENTPRITALASGLNTFRAIEEEITAAILSEEEISDHASPALYDIRRKMRRCNDRVREKLNNILHSASMQKHLQDAIITMRNDRYVIPVKLESRSAVPGLVHDQSASGATLFIEPMAVVEIGNELKQCIAEEKREIERILTALSNRIAPEAPLLIANQERMAHLDFLFAKGLLSRQMRGTSPKINTEGRIRIVRGRHPLIDPDKVVPVDLWMGETFNILIITGPNTGGKTVTLKTVGLFTLMMQAGLQVPADLGTELSVFSQVHADIGDEQSIEQSLSTFSSHMTNIVRIMEGVADDALVLFDELGAGTDPTEGAALAQAILGALLSRDIRTLATTHYSELKAFALTTDGVENASVEFDVETLRPTYRLSIGVPGKSNAFEISQRLGLSKTLIQKARELLSQEQIRFEDVIANAEYHRKVAEKERALAESARAEMTSLRDQAEAMRTSLQEQREKQLRKAREDARQILERAKQDADEVMSELRRLKKNVASDSEAAGNQLRQQLREGLDALNESLAEPVETVVKPPQNLKPGDSVMIVHLNTKGTVLDKPNDKGEVQVQAGIMRLKAHVSQLKRVKEESAGTTSARSHVDIATRSVKLELDVRGMALDEALPEVDKFLDDAVLSSLGEVSVIHGKGTGTLRSGIQTHLRKHPHVEAYRLGKYGEGEAGVTVVTIKK